MCADILFTFVTISDPPSPPGSLSVSDTSPDSVTLTWTLPPSDGGAAVTHYIIEQRLASETNFMQVGKVDGMTFSYKTTGLTKDKDYMFCVKAENPAGVSSEGAQLEKPVTAKHPFGMLSILFHLIH